MRNDYSREVRLTEAAIGIRENWRLKSTAVACILTVQTINPGEARGKKISGYLSLQAVLTRKEPEINETFEEMDVVKALLSEVRSIYNLNVSSYE